VSRSMRCTEPPVVRERDCHLKAHRTASTLILLILGLQSVASAGSRRNGCQRPDLGLSAEEPFP
jgi:hypothetical protein